MATAPNSSLRRRSVLKECAASESSCGRSGCCWRRTRTAMRLRVGVLCTLRRAHAGDGEPDSDSDADSGRGVGSRSVSRSRDDCRLMLLLSVPVPVPIPSEVTASARSVATCSISANGFAIDSGGGTCSSAIGNVKWSRRCDTPSSDELSSSEKRCSHKMLCSVHKNFAFYLINK